ncbi:DUF1404 family protein [Saccharolobus islandicus]|uniref:Uncharacterized protein n=2 Tax=Saccharolobus islandicus TaxID=43080 RepID=C4KJX9_SACI6|nr:DUF1404 family protein [Sulfolobus islandicus]ACR42774.1 Protein of unknown function DUF1404 [Sulfolobus islandicus M.16.4]
MKFTLYIIYTKLTKLLFTLGGRLVGSYIPLMNTSVKLGLLVLWITADSVVSIILTIEWPYYSNSIYSISPWPLDQEVLTATLMFLVMTTLFIIALSENTKIVNFQAFIVST